jgi:Zn-dependent protease with chaperone function
MRWGRRSDLMLAGLGMVALANGALLGLTGYGFLAAALGILGFSPPAATYFLLLGIGVGIWLLVKAGQLERALRQGDYSRWGFSAAVEQQAGYLVERLDRAFANSCLTRRPTLRLLPSSAPNAFSVGRSREEAFIVVTQGLLGRLTPAEQDAVLAHEMAHIEAEDVPAVGLADAIAESIADFSALKGNVLWGPRQIAIGLVPLVIVFLVSFALVEVVPKPGEIANLGEAVWLLLLCFFYLGVLAAIAGSALASWPGLLQLFFFVTFFGPLTLIEMALAPPTAVILSRLVSRARIYEADIKTEQLCENSGAFLSALKKLEDVEREPDETWAGSLRFSLLVTPRKQKGYQAWFERVWATHPSIAERVEALGGAVKPATAPTRAAAPPG